MTVKHPWRWTVGSLAVIFLSAVAFMYYRLNEALRGDYETIRVIQLVEDYVKTHEGNWPTSWKDLDGTEEARLYSPLDSTYWQKYTRVDFTLTSEQLIENPNLIYNAVTPMSGEYIVYPHARMNLDELMRAICNTKKLPKLHARPWSRQPQLVQPLHQQLDVIATVKPEFRIFRRRPEDNSWDDGSPFDRTTALAVLNALVTATPWDHNSHAAAYGMHASTPNITIGVTWCKDIKDESQRDTQSVHFCYGNRLFWYGNNVYQLSEQSHDVLNGIFPENK